MVAGVHPGWVHEVPHAHTIKVRATTPKDAEELTEREVEVLRAVCLHGTGEAARVLFVATPTVKNHLTAVFRKLRIRGHQKIGRGCYLLGRQDQRLLTP